MSSSLLLVNSRPFVLSAFVGNFIYASLRCLQDFFCFLPNLGGHGAHRFQICRDRIFQFDAQGVVVVRSSCANLGKHFAHGSTCSLLLPPLVVFLPLPLRIFLSFPLGFFCFCRFPSKLLQTMVRRRAAIVLLPLQFLAIRLHV
eukprot:Skav220155  [mRNA]  locus=scaffold564:98365:106519:- [translate_table: standard]